VVGIELLDCRDDSSIVLRNYNDIYNTEPDNNYIDPGNDSNTWNHNYSGYHHDRIDDTGHHTFSRHPDLRRNINSHDQLG
jgi:hypothetical protein